MILVVGANGLVGSTFRRLLGDSALYLTRSDCDFRDTAKLLRKVKQSQCTTIINCAAIVSFDRIASDPHTSFLINSLLPQTLSSYCGDNNLKYAHISTDHFFNDVLDTHDEACSVSLLNKYAEQKFVAESIVINLNKEALVIRTSMLGFKPDRSHTLMHWILSTLKYKPEIDGFIDSITSSIDVDTLCVTILQLLKVGESGLYNIGCNHTYSKYDLIKACAEITGAICHIRPSKVSVLNVPRSKNCGLDVNKVQNRLGIRMPDLKSALNTLKVLEYYEKL